MIVKAKLWRVFSWTKLGVDNILKEFNGPGWEGGFLEESLRSTGRFVPTAMRLGFHGCLREEYGTGGCDGCLWAESISRLYLDYWAQRLVPLSGSGAPNSNNGLKAVTDVMEELYTNSSFPDRTPVLNKSLFASGKSRSDLWSFAAGVAVEWAIGANNMVCTNPEFEWPQAHGDSLETNGYWGQHCVQKKGKADCKILLQNRIKFKTGRQDCVPGRLYQKVNSSSCPERLQIKTAEDCRAAAVEEQLLANETTYSAEDERCSITTEMNKSLCHLAIWQKYNTGPEFYVQGPLDVLVGGRTCRQDEAVVSEDECKRAAEYLMIPWGGHEHLDVRGCWVVNLDVGPGEKKLYVEYLPTGPLPAADRKDVRNICRMPNERVERWMAPNKRPSPNSQLNGSGTVNFFRKEFNLNPRETVALMGAHNIGRFHATRSLFRYIWLRNGGMVFNNEYYQMMANRPAYRFTDSCTQIGDAFSQAPVGRWRAIRRGEQPNSGPVFWLIDRFMCQKDCRPLTAEQRANESCCQSLAPGGTCTADNSRTSPSMDPVQGDPDVTGGCENWNSEPGNHEMMLPSEIGLYFKFDVDSNEQPSACPGFENFYNPSCDYFSGQNCTYGPLNCGKNEEPADDNLRMHELVELYADNQNLWVKEFNEVFEKVLENQVGATLTEGPDPTTDIVCPFQSELPDTSMSYWTCFSKNDLSPPFHLVNERDVATGGVPAYLQVNNITGKLEMLDGNDQPDSSATWYTVEVAGRQQLVNGNFEFGVGDLRLDETSGPAAGYLLAGSGTVLGYSGMLARPWTGLDVNFITTPETASWFQGLYQFQKRSV